jgi:hypothetical protein
MGDLVMIKRDSSMPVREVNVSVYSDGHQRVLVVNGIGPTREFASETLAAIYLEEALSEKYDDEFGKVTLTTGG